MYQGYKGVLCGSCDNNYGHVLNGECQTCKGLETGRILGVFLVALVSILVEIFWSFWGHQYVSPHEPQAAEGCPVAPGDVDDRTPPSAQLRDEAAEKAMEVFKVSPTGRQEIDRRCLC